MEDACVMETGFGALLTLEEEGKKNELILKLSKINARTSQNNDKVKNKEKDEDNGTPRKKEDFSKDNEDWSPTAVSSLLNACGRYNEIAIESGKLDMDCIWKEILKEVCERCKSSKKPKNLEQCKLKLKAMQSRYNREKMAKKFNPNECSSWEWYDTMNSLFVENPHLMANAIDITSIKQRINTNNDVLSSRALPSDKYVEKSIVDQNMLKKSLLDDVNGKLLLNDKEESFGSRLSEDEKRIQYSNCSTPSSPKSPRSFMKVKWRDSNPPQTSIMDRFKEDQTYQDNLSNEEPLDSQNGKKSISLVNDIKDKLLNCDQETSSNISTLDKKGKGTSRPFDSCSDNSTNCYGSDVTDQDSAALSPIILRSSQTKCISNKPKDVGSSQKNVEDQHTSRCSLMELSTSVNCNYKCTCVENITNVKRGNEKKGNSKDISLKIDEPKSPTIHKVLEQEQHLTSNVARRDEHMTMNIGGSNLDANSTKTFSKGSSLASLTSQSESSCSSKKKGTRGFSKYKYEQGNQSNRILMTRLMRAKNNMPQLKKKLRPLNQTFLAHEPNMITALMTFGAMIQQLERNHITLMERTLNEQSTILKDFVKTLKYNHQVRQDTTIGLVVRFLLSIFLIGVILLGTSKTTSSWIPKGFQSSSWYGKNIDDSFSQLAWMGCFIIVLFTQLLWTSFNKRPITPSHS